MDISIVIPVYNEAQNIELLIKETVRTLGDSLGYELICVDDASTDDTLERLKALKETIPNLRVLEHSFNCGQSTALCTGIRAAKAPVIVTMDGDGQNDPHDIPRMLDIFLDPSRPSNVHMLAGLRRRRLDSCWRRFTSRVANSVRMHLLKDNTPDTGCGLKVFYRETFLSLPYFDHMHRFLPALVRRAGMQVETIEVNHRPRVHGSSHYNVLNRLWAGLVDLAGVLWLQKRIKIPEVKEWRMEGDDE